MIPSSETSGVGLAEAGINQGMLALRALLEREREREIGMLSRRIVARREVRTYTVSSQCRDLC